MPAGDHDTPTLLAPSKGTDETVSGDGRTTGRARPIDGPRDLPRGSTVGRYVVIDLLGRGGMGVVYAAYDPELDRKIAVKLVKCGPAESGMNTAGRSRLLREAQALAKLSHPNIVSVYDVGTLGDSIFVAMEFVAGRTVSAWLDRHRATAPPRWREVLEILLPAGRGLAAAHEAGIIHRDFKPDNVMVDGGGRVVVLDFGLARPVGGRDSSTGEPARIVEAASMSSSLLLPLTVTGSLMGTPAYMSPEQFMGRDIDAASDQFSFCVALYEALYGERPFPGETINELACAVLEERLRPVPRGATVPGWLRKVVVRGLAREVDDRWPSMQALLTALQRDPAQRRRRLALGAVAGTVLVAGTWASVVSQREDPCEHYGDVVREAWGPQRRSSLEASFRRDAMSYSEDTLSRLSAELDAWSDTWLVARSEACEGLHANHPETVNAASLRGACLDTALRRFEALVRVLVDADQSMVAKALGAVQRLPKPSSCEDVQGYLRSVPTPDDADLREGVEALRVRTADILALFETGQLESALELATELLEQAEALGYAPMIAELQSLRGGSLLQLGRFAEALETLETAAMLTREHGLDELSRQALRGLAFLHTAYTKKHELADWILRDVDILIGRLGDEPVKRADLLIDRGRFERIRGDNDAAIDALERAVAILQEHEGAPSMLVVALDNLATSYIIEDRLDDASAVLEQGEDVASRGLGKTHPLRGNFLVHRARVASSREQYEAAAELYRAGLRVFEGAYGEVHPNIAAVHNNLGLALQRAGDREGAIEAFRRAVAVFEKAFGPEHAEISRVLLNLGNVLRQTGRASEAESVHRRALALREQHDLARDEILDVKECLADDLRVQDRCDEAEPLYREAVAGREQDESTHLVYALTGLGLCLARRGELDASIAILERAVGTTKDDLSAMWRAYARFALAIALRDAGREPRRAIDLVHEARDLLEPERPEHEALLHDLGAWLDGEAILHPAI